MNKNFFVFFVLFLLLFSFISASQFLDVVPEDVSNKDSKVASTSTTSPTETSSNEQNSYLDDTPEDSGNKGVLDKISSMIDKAFNKVASLFGGDSSSSSPESSPALSENSLSKSSIKTALNSFNYSWVRASARNDVEAKEADKQLFSFVEANKGAFTQEQYSKIISSAVDPKWYTGRYYEGSGILKMLQTNAALADRAWYQKATSGGSGKWKALSWVASKSSGMFGWFWDVLYGMLIVAAGIWILSKKCGIGKILEVISRIPIIGFLFSVGMGILWAFVGMSSSAGVIWITALVINILGIIFTAFISTQKYSLVRFIARFSSHPILLFLGSFSIPYWINGSFSKMIISFCLQLCYFYLFSSIERYLISGLRNAAEKGTRAGAVAGDKVAGAVNFFSKIWDTLFKRGGGIDSQN